MLLVEKKHKKKITQIITEAFEANPSVNWVVKNDHKKEQRIRALAEYSFDTAFRRNGVFVSDNLEGVALCYKYNFRKESLADYYAQLKLLFKSIGVTRVFEVLNRQAYISKHRPKDGYFLYFWFFGVSNKGRGSHAAKQLKDEIFNLSKETNLPIYLETSVEKNKKVYERYGFDTYHVWHYEKKGIDLHFMKRDPGQYP